MDLEITIDDVRGYDTAVKSQLSGRDVDQYYGGLYLFIDSWAGGGQTYDTAYKLSEKFDLGLGSSVEALESKFDKPYKALEEIDYLLSHSLLVRINNLSELVKIGGSYSTGWNGLEYGLTFVADTVAVKALIAETKLKSSSVVTAKAATGYFAQCFRTAIEFIKQVDFGHVAGQGLHLLDLAAKTLERCGVQSEELLLAIKVFSSDLEHARQLVYGPSGVDSNKGVLNDLIDKLDLLNGKDSSFNHLERSPVMTARFVVYAGVMYERAEQVINLPANFISVSGEVYERVDENPASFHVAYHEPKEMKGVEKCRADSIDDNRSMAEQKWCVYDSKGRLKKRCRNKKEALDHKVFLIRMYWTKGKGKNSGNRPNNTRRKPVHR